MKTTETSPADKARDVFPAWVIAEMIQLHKMEADVEFRRTKPGTITITPYDLHAAMGRAFQRSDVIVLESMFEALEAELFPEGTEAGDV